MADGQTFNYRRMETDSFSSKPDDRSGAETHFVFRCDPFVSSAYRAAMLIVFCSDVIVAAALARMSSFRTPDGTGNQYTLARDWLPFFFSSSSLYSTDVSCLQILNSVSWTDITPTGGFGFAHVGTLQYDGLKRVKQSSFSRLCSRTLERIDK